MAPTVYYFTDAQAFGGAERALLMLLETVNREDWSPTLLHHPDPTGLQLAECAQAIDIPTRPVPRLPLGALGARRVPRLVRDLRVSAPAVFHAHLSWPLAAKYPLAAAVAARVPGIVATVHLVPEFTLDRSNRLQLQILSRFVGRYVAVSEDVSRRLHRDLGWPAAKIDVIYNGVRLGEFTGTTDPQLRLELCRGRPGPLFLTVARLDAQKGHDVLLRAAALVPGVQFALAGEGPERSSLEEFTAELGLGDRVRFLGSRTDVPALLATADAFVLSSHVEGSPLAILEAMAAGKPVIATAIGGTDEVVEHGQTGLLVPQGDVEALAAAMRELAEDSALRMRLGAMARVRAEQQFSVERSTAQTTKIYEELLGQR